MQHQKVSRTEPYLCNLYSFVMCLFKKCMSMFYTLRMYEQPYVRAVDLAFKKGKKEET